MAEANDIRANADRLGVPDSITEEFLGQQRPDDEHYFNRAKTSSPLDSLGIPDPGSYRICGDTRPGISTLPSLICDYPAGHGPLYDSRTDDAPFEHGTRSGARWRGWGLTAEARYGRVSDLCNVEMVDDPSIRCDQPVGHDRIRVLAHPDEFFDHGNTILKHYFNRPDLGPEVPIKQDYYRPPTLPPPPQRTILDEADALINGERQDAYGHPLDTYTVLADLINALPPPPGNEHTAESMSVWHVLNKVARYATSGYRWHRDTVLDIAGYAGVLELIHDERERRP